MRIILSGIIAFGIYNTPALAANDIILEYAAGIVSEHLPLTSKWGGPVLEDGSHFKEHAIRASYDINEHFGVYATAGWIDRWNFREARYIALPPPDGYFNYSENNQQAIYIIPGFKFSAEIFKLDFGGIVYHSNISGVGDAQYPFNGSHRFKPSFMAAIGDEDIYLYAGFLNSLPMFSGGGAEVGMYGRVGGYYEQKVYFGGNHGPGIGYRGEFKMTRNTALALGISLGHNDHSNDTVYGIMAGVKVRIPGRE